jgi:hypothetical protein
MKRIILLLIVMLVALCQFTILAKDKEEAQPFPRDEKGNIVFQGVVEVPGVSATDLYARAKFWAAKAFISAQDVIQLDDPASGRLVLKGSYEEIYMGSQRMWFNFTMTIEVKDEKYRWTIDQLDEQGHSLYLNKEGVGIVGRKAVYERFRKALITISEELKVEMTKVPDKNW